MLKSHRQPNFTGFRGQLQLPLPHQKLRCIEPSLFLDAAAAADVRTVSRPPFTTVLMMDQENSPCPPVTREIAAAVANLLHY